MELTAHLSSFAGLFLLLHLHTLSLLVCHHGRHHRAALIANQRSVAYRSVEGRSVDLTPLQRIAWYTLGTCVILVALAVALLVLMGLGLSEMG